MSKLNQITNKIFKYGLNLTNDNKNSLLALSYEKVYGMTNLNKIYQNLFTINYQTLNRTKTNFKKQVKFSQMLKNVSKC